jgi:DNA-binding CsgD family transcriptional regulator
VGSGLSAVGTTKQLGEQGQFAVEICVGTHVPQLGVGGKSETEASERTVVRTEERRLVRGEVNAYVQPSVLRPLSPMSQVSEVITQTAWRRAPAPRSPPRRVPQAPARRARRLENVGAAAWEERARAELRASGETLRRRADESATDALTPQERTIARLVAQGRTNRDVAEQLFLSVRTVSSTCATCSSSSTGSRASSSSLCRSAGERGRVTRVQRAGGAGRPRGAGISCSSRCAMATATWCVGVELAASRMSSLLRRPVRGTCVMMRMCGPDRTSNQPRTALPC